MTSVFCSRCKFASTSLSEYTLRENCKKMVMRAPVFNDSPCCKSNRKHVFLISNSTERLVWWPAKCAEQAPSQHPAGCQTSGTALRQPRKQLAPVSEEHTGAPAKQDGWTTGTWAPARCWSTRTRYLVLSVFWAKWAGK